MEIHSEPIAIPIPTPIPTPTPRVASIRPAVRAGKSHAFKTWSITADELLVKSCYAGRSSVCNQDLG
jgi:hypothetical protein